MPGMIWIFVCSNLFHNFFETYFSFFFSCSYPFARSEDLSKGRPKYGQATQHRGDSMPDATTWLWSLGNTDTWCDHYTGTSSCFTQTKCRQKSKRVEGCSLSPDSEWPLHYRSHHVMGAHRWRRQSSGRWTWNIHVLLFLLSVSVVSFHWVLSLKRLRTTIWCGESLWVLTTWVLTNILWMKILQLSASLLYNTVLTKVWDLPSIPAQVLYLNAHNSSLRVLKKFATHILYVYTSSVNVNWLMLLLLIRNK